MMVWRLCPETGQVEESVLEEPETGPSETEELNLMVYAEQCREAEHARRNR
jgi:hypothetical protein